MSAPDGSRRSSGAFKQRFQPVTLQSVGISYAIGGKQLLHDVSATFAPSQVAALMGPSGAGKTTLLNVLCGRAPGDVTGRVLMNGREVTAAEYRSVLTLMPQADILHGALTVEQAVQYAARMRCPPEWPEAEKLAAAERIMETLGLERVRAQVIGSEHTVGGISGGQRKRCSAAVEFLSCRPLLFMDEPTSGLDSAAAKSLMSHLAHVAMLEGRTVIATIHQPAWAIMSLFESVLLLAKGGHVCYRGDPEGIPGYFAAHGAPCPDSENPADHMLYALSTENGPAEWSANWKKHEVAHDLVVKAAPVGDVVAKATELSPLAIWATLTRRTYTVYFQDPSQFRTQFGIMTITLGIVGLQGLDAANTYSKANLIFYFGLLLYMASTLCFVIVMPMERAVILREFRNGMYSTNTYWLARCALVVCVAAMQATYSQAIIYPMLGLPDHPNAKIFKWFLVSFLYLLTTNMFGLLLGICLPSAMISIKAVPAIMNIWLVGAGAMPPLNRMRPAMAWTRYPQPLSYAVKAFWIIGFDNGEHQSEKVLRDREWLDISPGNEDSMYQALFINVVVFFCLGMLGTNFRLNKVDSSAGHRKAPAPKAGDPQIANPIADEEEGESTAYDSLIKHVGGDKGYGGTKIDGEDDLTPVTLTTRRLSFTPAGSQKKTLHEVNATFATGTCTALMGPSGAGKSTMLNVLVGRMKGTHTGEIHANGNPIDPWAFRLVSTFTPQDDYLFPDLSVRQTMYYTSRLRSDRALSHAQKLERADAVIAQLGLVEAADVVVGNDLKPGISGGQKKRLSIGIDLLAKKSVMFLDEPTTGLDSNAAMTVMKIVQRLGSGTARTVVCTIHQPQWAVMAQFDQLVLIAAGKNIYAGAPNRVADFFAAGGRPRDENENPADHMMFALTEDGPDKWAAQWTMQGARYAPEAPLQQRKPPVVGEYSANPLQQFGILLERCTVVFLTDEDQGIEFLMPPLFIALIAGASFYNMGYNIWLTSGFLLAGFSITMLAMIGMVLNIPLEKPVVLREFRNGTYCIEAYMFARIVLAIVAASIVAVVQVPIWWTMFDMPPSHRAKVQLITAAINSIYAILGCLIGVCSSDPITASQNSEPFVGAIILFSGILVPHRHIKSYLMWIYKAVPMAFYMESIVSLGFENQGPEAEDIMDYLDFEGRNYGRNLGVILCWLGAIIVLAIVAAKYFMCLTE